MFFSISKLEKQNFPCQHRLGKFVVNTDNGWQQQNFNQWQVVYKGYSEDGTLSNLLPRLVEESSPGSLGNFCVLAYNSTTNTLTIHTDRYRSFPIYNHNNEITNLNRSSVTYWTDSLLEIDDNMTVTEKKFDAIGSLDDTPLTVDQVVESVEHLIDNKVKNFLQHNQQQPIRVFLSGGVDSLLVFSFLQKYTNDYEFVKNAHIDYDYFFVHNQGLIQSNWAYRQIHHWQQLCVLTSGAPGDEFMLRSPTTSHMFLAYHNLDTLEELTKRSDCLHSYYFNQTKHLEIFSNKNIPVFENKSQMMHYLCNIVVNDWQHWHLGNTLTWTPLRDLGIFKLILRLPVTDALDQIFDSKLSLRLIEKNMPGASKLISDQKNDLAPMKNLIDFLDLPR